MADDLTLPIRVEGSARARAELDGVAGGLDDIGDEAKQAERKLHSLGRAIEITAAKSKLLTERFAETGDSFFMKEFGQNERSLAGLKRMHKALDDTERAAGKLSKTLGGGSRRGGGIPGLGLLSGLGPGPSAALAAFALPLLVGAGGLASTAVLGAAGLAGVGGGAALAASSSPRVQEAFTGLGKDTLSRLQDDAQSFRQPLVEAAEAFGDAFDRQEPRIRAILETASKFVKPLSEGFAGFGETFLPGFQKGLEGAEPLMRELGRDLPRVGRSLGDFFGIIAEAGPGAAASFDLLTDSLDALLGSSAVGIVTLSKLAEAYSFVNDVAPPLTGLIGTFNILDTGAETAAEGTKDLTGALRGASDAAVRLEGNLEDANKSIHDLLGIQIDSKEAAIGWEKSLDDLRESVKDNGKTLDITNEKGRENAEMLLGAARAAETMRQSNVASGMSAGEANAKYQAQIDFLVRLGAQLGLSRQAVLDLIAGLKDIPPDISTNVNVRLKLAGFSQDDIREASRAQLGGGKISSGKIASGKPLALQHGGLLGPGQRALVGEVAPEVAVGLPGGGAYVAPLVPRGGGGDDVIGTLRVVHERPTGEHIRTELVTLRRRRGYTSFDKMVPA